MTKTITIDNKLVVAKERGMDLGRTWTQRNSSSEFFMAVGQFCILTVVVVTGICAWDQIT